MEKLKPNDQMAKNAIIFIWIVLILEVVSFISSYLQYDLLQTVANGGYISPEAADANDNREQTIYVIYLIAFIISAITFIVWFRRAYYNLHQKVDSLLYSEGWAAGSWFIPIINLYRPYKIMKELYVKTKELLEKRGFLAQVNYTTSYVGWWWSIWIIKGFISNFMYRYSLKADTVNEYIALTVAGMIFSILNILCALITVKIIKDYSKVESLLKEV
ncbi:MAG: DUF4328 domain-containing protein [Campylobacteraceae bacterium]|nr:DUF4328 domain-containing protein [Campylobacteraceae bacterium]